jgi:hypothetical protein
MDRLSDIFYDPKTGYVSINRLIAKARDAKITLTDDEIRDWYSKQEINNTFAQPPTRNKVESFAKIYAPTIGYLVADLIDISNLYKSNAGYHWILTMIDTHSRYAWAFPLKSKSPTEVAPDMRKVFEVIKAKAPLWERGQQKAKERFTLTTDDGSEWKGDVGKLIKEFDVEHFIGNPKDNTKRRTAMVESFNKSLLRLIFKVLHANDTVRWVDILDDVMKNYNSTPHSSTKESPIDIFEGKVKSEETPVEYHDDFKIGDKVLIAKFLDDTSGTFAKKTREPSYGTQTYLIVGRDGIRYRLSEDAPILKILPKSYLPRQLRKVGKISTAPREEKPKLLKGDRGKSVLPKTSELIKQAKSEKRFTTLQRTSGLDVNKEGDIIVPKAVKTVSEKRKPKPNPKYAN